MLAKRTDKSAELRVEELLFLSKSFESVGNGSLQLQMEEGYNPLDFTNTLEHELFQGELLL